LTATSKARSRKPANSRLGGSRRTAEADPDDAFEDEGDLKPAAAPDSFNRLRRGGLGLPRADDTESEDEHAWMTTYTDMVTLLLTCFILLISLASFSEPKSTGDLPPPVTETAAADPILSDESAFERVPDALFLRQPPDSWSARLSRDLERFVDRAAVRGGMTVVSAETMVTVRLNDRLLFPSGRVELQQAGRELLRELAPLLAAAPERIEVRGHTDSVPISTWLFPSNWELSGARAAAVVRALIDSGIDPGRLSATGFADTEPLASDDSAEGRQENRRVEVVLRARFDPPEAVPIPAPTR